MEEHEKHYLRGDGNGGYAMSRSIATLTTIALVFSLITAVVSVTAFGITNKNRIDCLGEDVNEMRIDINLQEARADSIEQTMVNIDTRLEGIESSVNELNDDFKEFLRN